MNFEAAERLDVWRTLTTGERHKVGVLAQNDQQVFFQYDENYLETFANLSPFLLADDSSLQAAPKSPHHGLHGVFGDSLPDGWGFLVMNRVFRQAGILSNQVTAMDRLAFVGNRAMGALSYEPVSPWQTDDDAKLSRVSELGLQAQALFEGQTTSVLDELARVGSSGGARPKTQLYLSDDDSDTCSTVAKSGFKPYLVKFTSKQFALGHEEGLCEAAYLTMAKQAGIDVPNWRLLSAPSASGASDWLALERFDVSEQGGRIHCHSACGLLDADFRLPSLDYEDLIKASSILTKNHKDGQAQFRRMVFNLLALNQDDHSKNWAFLQRDNGRWLLAPFYDVTFSLSPYGEHSTAFAGYGKNPSLKAMQQLAAQAGFDRWEQAKQVIDEVVEAISCWSAIAKQLGVSKETALLIAKQLDVVRKENRFK